MFVIDATSCVKSTSWSILCLDVHTQCNLSKFFSSSNSEKAAVVELSAVFRICISILSLGFLVPFFILYSFSFSIVEKITAEIEVVPSTTKLADGSGYLGTVLNPDTVPRSLPKPRDICLFPVRPRKAQARC